MKAYTDSVLGILSSAQLVKKTPPKYYDEFEHNNCEQARYQAMQMKKVKREQTKVTKKTIGNKYSVPTSNMFNHLENCNNQGNY